MNPIPLEVQAIVQTVDPSKLTDNLLLVALTGGASLIGAYAVIKSNKMQIESMHTKEATDRAFTARRETFESGLRLFHFIAVKRWDGIRVLPGDEISEKYDGYGAMARLNLHASKKLMSEISEKTKAHSIKTRKR